MDDTRPGTTPPVNRPVTGPPTSSDASFSDFLTFRAFITPTFITVIWVIGAVFITLAVILAMGGQGGVVHRPPRAPVPGLPRGVVHDLSTTADISWTANRRAERSSWITRLSTP